MKETHQPNPPKREEFTAKQTKPRGKETDKQKNAEKAKKKQAIIS